MWPFSWHTEGEGVNFDIQHLKLQTLEVVFFSFSHKWSSRDCKVFEYELPLPNEWRLRWVTENEVKACENWFSPLFYLFFVLRILFGTSKDFTLPAEKQLKRKWTTSSHGKQATFRDANIYSSRKDVWDWWQVTTQSASDWFRLALCTRITLFCTFLCSHCTTATISRLVEDVNTRQRLAFSFPELWSRF